MSKGKKQTNLVPEKLEFIADLSRTSAWIANRYTLFLKPYGISTQQFNILRVLRNAEDWIAMNEVNDRLIIKSPNITRLADKLVMKGLIERKRSEEDRRVVYVRIETTGLELLADIDNQHEGDLSSYMNSFSKEEAIMMRKILARIRE